MNYTIAINATCPMQLTLYFYNELQVVIAIGKCNCKPNCETPIFLMVRYFSKVHIIMKKYSFCVGFVHTCTKQIFLWGHKVQ